MEALLDRLTRLQLQVVVVAPPDATRLSAMDGARTAAIVAGRGELLDQAAAAARELALKAFAGAGFSGTWAATEMAASVVSARDRVAAAAAFEEAATAAVVEDLVDVETLEVLRSTSNELLWLSDVPVPGSLSSLGSAATSVHGPLQVVIVATGAIVGMAFAFAIGSVSGLIVAALAIAVIAGVARRLARSDR